MPRRTPFEKAMHEMLFGEIKKEYPFRQRRGEKFTKKLIRDVNVVGDLSK